MRKIIITILAISFILIQFYRPNKNVDTDTDKPSDFLIIHKPPNNIKTLLVNSCYDCHSNNTNYHWYDNIMPIGWWIDNNIKKGKDSMNFSEWSTYEPWQKLSLLSAMEFDINTNRMPTEEYLFLHTESSLTKEQQDSIIRWISSIDRSQIY